ncbi:hypothetical protein [uncultured Brachyspira sp.]|uniref:hypothetical protein n=1 Tax=uncultured Brachyspira sp. TaxID=221953 RepID=UPI0025E42460|nr:hypothetical protein [uncultured Brachyspira sp.]
MKNINKFIILIFAFTVMFSSVLFAEWKVGIDGDVMFIANYDKKNESAIVILIDTSIADDWFSAYNNYKIAAVVFHSNKISEESSLYLDIKRKSNNNIKYHITDEDILMGDENYYVGIGVNSENGVRANNLIKILLDSVNAELYNEDTDELLGYFNLNGLDKTLKENLGDTEWYSRNIRK